MRLSGLSFESFVDGPGLRIVLFAQGCIHECPHCQNPQTWDIKGGEEFSVKQIVRLIKKNIKNKQGVTFSGGEPFLQAAEFAQVAQFVCQMELDVVTFSGFTYEQLLDDQQPLSTNKINGAESLLKMSNLLIDGKYIHELRDINLQFRGSSNQRIVDVASSMKSGKVVLWEQ